MTARTRGILVGVLFVLVVAPVLLPTQPFVRIGAAVIFIGLASWLVYTWLHDEHERETRDEAC